MSIDGKKIIRLQKVKQMITELESEEKVLKQEIQDSIPKGVKRVESPYGVVSLFSRKSYIFTEEVESIKEELKLAQSNEQEVAVSRKDWEKLGSPSNVPIYDEKVSLRVTNNK